ncbi:MAG: dihydroorotate dehydrogenase [archaeon]|nr:dihydroorotate dehydrogenase [archaeon]
MSKISVELAGLKLKSPLILASGILGISPSSMHVLADQGIGGVTTKSIGPKGRIGYSNPSIIGLGNGTFLNAVGLANPGIEVFEKEIPEIKEKKDLIVIVSVFGDGPDGYADIAERAWKAGADAIELNISCPHAEVSAIGADPDLTSDFVKATRSRIKCPLLVKMNPNVTDITLAALAAEKAGADAVVAINTLRGLAIDINTFRPFLAHGVGGLSGKAIKPIGLKDVYSLYKKIKIPIIGCGGISTYKDVIEYFLAGASAVQLGSALYQGTEIISKINENLDKFLQEKSIENIAQLTGKSHEFEMELKPKCE